MLSDDITILVFDTHEEMRAALEAVARAKNIRRISYVNGAEKVTTVDDHEIRFGVRGRPDLVRRLVLDMPYLDPASFREDGAR